MSGLSFGAVVILFVRVHVRSEGKNISRIREALLKPLPEVDIQKSNFQQTKRKRYMEAPDINKAYGYRIIFGRRSVYWETEELQNDSQYYANEETLNYVSLINLGKLEHEK
ncbi:hypothetical protein MKS88_002597 [Plasmodium brasilianum]|uniref:Uncharacterized protein n=1 Tax=Plasmodium brasilianum TaxID=5824 RepID=A0ACB9YBU7_PLABR|nr:hypothetical protein MKS88_002597 [Plasmodium brasilianum]